MARISAATSSRAGSAGTRISSPGKLSAVDAIGPLHQRRQRQCGLSLVSNYGAPGVTPSNTIIKPVSAYGGNIGYRHVWTPEMRSNIGAGYYHQDVNNVATRSARGSAHRRPRPRPVTGATMNKELSPPSRTCSGARLRSPISGSSTSGPAPDHRERQRQRERTHEPVPRALLSRSQQTTAFLETRRRPAGGFLFGIL